jgi:putative N6-adenine-specific DNA methylase
VKDDRSRILITCAKGIAPFLKKELSALKYPIVSETSSGIHTEGTREDLIWLNLQLRTGHRVFQFLKEFSVHSIGQFYLHIKSTPWENYLSIDGYFSVSSHVESSLINDSRYANKKCKDAIVDRFREKFNQRPDSGPEKNRLVLFLYWRDTVCSVYIDTSGEPLSRRNYRKNPYKAPMQETLAAAVIMASNWNYNATFVNPMCGSGTLAIEAAMAARNIAPGILRENFGFMHIKGFNRIGWDRLRLEAEKKIKKISPCRIIATDIDPRAVEAAQQNARAAGLEHSIEFETCAYDRTFIPSDGGIVMLNPEYGERLGRDKDLESVYKGIGDFFKNKCKGYKGYIFTGNLGMAKKVGLRTKRRLQFFNSRIECRLLEYELYEGSRKHDQA